MKALKAAEFKATCLRVLGEVDRTGEPVTILKRGRPVARLVPAVPSTGRYPQDDLAGTVEILGDIGSPVLPPTAWEGNRPRCAKSANPPPMSWPSPSSA
ncbi:MAG TPA: type II toxin-antitoxin system Phd/YefM family antitoxin [Candidatus Binatia bacterium]|nr:type II toxin-antitoxin system Phd/YefM family antitoxin [Candidatus Binatia bacterium]